MPNNSEHKWYCINEIRYHGCSHVMYMYADYHQQILKEYPYHVYSQSSYNLHYTYDSIYTRECRGIVFDEKGNVSSRPLHKFFNLNENEEYLYDKVKNKRVFAIYEKLDGSIVSSANVGGWIFFRSKKSFSSDVVSIADKFILDHENYYDFCDILMTMGFTAIFELTSPLKRIVINYPSTKLTLLHVRDNISGRYELLDPNSPIYDLIKKYNIPLVKKFDYTLDQAIEACKQGGIEGFVVQFEDGDMVKIKTKWYCERHRVISFLRERDIAELVLDEKLDDVKSIFNELGIDLGIISKIESKVKGYLIEISENVDKVYKEDRQLSRKDFAIKNLKNPYFSLLMEKFSQKEPDFIDFYRKNRLKSDFGLEDVCSQKED